MTVLADFAEVLGDQGQPIGVAQGNASVALPPFNTGGRLGGHSAFLMFLASGLQGSAGIFVNGQHVGAVFPTGPGNVVSTQMASFSGAVLKDGTNTVELRNVTEAFHLRNVYCFFHQNS